MQCSAHRRHCCTACLQVHVLFSCVKAWPTRSPPPDAPRRCPRPRRPHLHRLGCRRRCRRRQHRRRPCRRHHCRRRRHPHLRNRPSPPPPAPPPSELSCAESRECGPVRRCARGCRACSAPQPNRERRPAWDVSARAGALRTTARGVARARMPVRLPRVASARRRRRRAARRAGAGPRHRCAHARAAPAGPGRAEAGRRGRAVWVHARAFSSVYMTMKNTTRHSGQSSERERICGRGRGPHCSGGTRARKSYVITKRRAVQLYRSEARSSGLVQA